MSLSDPNTFVYRAALLAIATALTLVSASAARLAVTHMEGLGSICGDERAAHCPWCAVALITLAAGLIVTGLLSRPPLVVGPRGKMR